MLSAPLAKPLKTKYKISNIPVRSGDKVKVVRGQFKGQRGKVDIVKLAQLKICIEGLQQVKKDGSKAYFPIHPSNVLVEELNLDDKKRRMKLEGVKQ
jgi:large subunit ribosomal protein L24